MTIFDCCHHIITRYRCVLMVVFFTHCSSYHSSLLHSSPTDSAGLRFHVVECRDMGSTSDEYAEMTYCRYEDGVLMHQPTIGDSLRFALYDGRTGALDSIFVDMTGIVPAFPLSSPNFTDIALSDRYLILLAFKGIVILELRPDIRHLRYLYSASLPFPFTRAGICGEKVLLGMCYNHRSQRGVKPTCLAVFDIPKRRIRKSLHPDFSGIQLTHFTPSQWIDFHDRYFLFADAARYRVRIYDTTLTLLATIATTPEGWLPLDVKKMDDLTSSYGPRSTKASLPELMRYVDANPGNVIRSAGFLDANHIFLSYTPSDSLMKRNFDRMYDIWSTQEGEISQWRPIARGLVTRGINRSDTCSAYGFTDYLQFGKTVALAGSQLGVVTRTPPVNLLFRAGVPYSTLESEAQQYFGDDHPFRYVFLRYSFR